MEPPSASPAEHLILLALRCEEAGDIAGALRAARQALETARSSGAPLECARALNAVARYRFRLGQYETARQLALESQAMTDPSQETSAVVHAEALLLLGMCALETNSLAECERYYRSAADLAREIGHTLLFQRALHNLASAVYLFHGQFVLAIAADSQSLQLCRQHGYTFWAMFPLITLAIAYQITNQRSPAQETLAELRSMAQPGSAGEGYACYVAGMLALDEEDFQTAAVELARAHAVAEAIGDPSLNLDARLGTSRLCRLRKENAQAVAWATDALGFAHRVGYRIYEGRALMECAWAAWLTGDPTCVESRLNQAEAIFNEMDLRYDLAGLYLLRAAFYHQQHDPRAKTLLPQATVAVQTGGYGFLLERERSLVFLLAEYLNDPDPAVAAAAGKLWEAGQAAPPRPLKIGTFGGLELSVGAQKVDPRALRQRRAGELLALLLSSPGYTLSAEQIGEAMCPEKEPQAAADFYHHAISSLRRLLEPELPDRRFPCRYLAVSEERVTLLIPPGSSLDFVEFEQHLQNKEWEQAIRLYRGEYLPMFCYAEWSLTLRQHFADRHEQALLTLAKERLAAGESAACLDLARQLLRQNEWQEQAVELGMRAALQLGDRVTALKLYRRLEKKLHQDLGIVPQKDLQELYRTAQKATR